MCASCRKRPATRYLVLVETDLARDSFLGQVCAPCGRDLAEDYDTPAQYAELYPLH